MKPCNKPLCRVNGIDLLHKFIDHIDKIIDETQMCDLAKSDLLKKIAHVSLVVAHGLDQELLTRESMATASNSAVILAPLDLAPQITALIDHYHTTTTH